MNLVRRSHVHGLLLLLAACTLLSAQPSKFEGLPVRNIQFEPKDQPIEAEELHDILPLKMNEPLAMKTVRASIERLFSTGRYADIKVDAQPYRDGVAIAFQTENSWFVGDIAITGNLGGPPTASQLENASGLDLGEPFHEADMQQAVADQKRLFEANGLFRSSIQPSLDWNTTREYQQVNIRFQVEQGPRARFASPILTGDLKMDADRIFKATKTRRWLINTWKPMTQSRVRQALDGVRTLYRRENRLEAKVTLESMAYDAATNSATPTFRIDAGPRIEIRTIGADVSRARLRQYIPIFEEHAVDRDLLIEGARNLRDYFQSRGYFEAEVEFKEQAVINDKASIDYLIATGERHRLAYIGIRGNEYFSTQDLRDRMYLRTASFLQFRYGRYSENLLRRDRDTIIGLYESNGFRDIQVTTRTEDNFQGRSGNIAVYIQIREGPQYFVHDLQVEGIESLDKSGLLSRLSSVQGQPFSEFNVAVDRDTILAAYFEAGFPSATFEWNYRPSAQPNQMDLHFTIHEGQRQFVRQVLVSGNRFTRIQLINRAITLGPGDPLSPTRITDVQRSLYSLGVFARVDTAIQNPEGQSDRKYVLFNVDEARRWSIAPGFGAELGRIGAGCKNCLTDPGGTTGFAPRVSLDISRSNLWGLGHSLSLRTRYSTLNHRGLLTYNWPRFQKKDNLSLAITGLYEQSQDIRTFNFKRIEASAQIIHRFSKATTLFYRYSYRRSSISDLKVTPFLASRLTQPVRVGITSLNLVSDRRDDPLDPHKGIYTTVDLGLAVHPFGSQVDFARILIRNSTYHPIGKRLVLARSTEIGDIAALRKSGDQAGGEIPFAERFFSGGGSSNRGFPENQAGPRDPGTGFPLGGTTLLFNQTELRFPLWGENLGGVLYHDMGNVYSKLANFSFRVKQRDIQDFDYMVHAAGIGIRYRTPVGPLRIDLGYSINPPRYFGFDGSTADLIAAGPTPCSPPAGVPNRCHEQRVSQFTYFFSIGQTF